LCGVAERNRPSALDGVSVCWAALVVGWLSRQCCGSRFFNQKIHAVTSGGTCSTYGAYTGFARFAGRSLYERANGYNYEAVKIFSSTRGHRRAIGFLSCLLIVGVAAAIVLRCDHEVAAIEALSWPV
jgi:hypothetical protein